VCSATGNSTEEDSELQPNVKFRKYIQNHIPSKNVVELDIIAMLREDHSDTALTGVTHYFKDSSNRDECIRQILGVFASKDVKNQMIIFFNTKAELANFYQKLKE
jgi:superfamily II DNA/RNA helicase